MYKVLLNIGGGLFATLQCYGLSRGATAQLKQNSFML